MASDHENASFSLWILFHHTIATHLSISSNWSFSCPIRLPCFFFSRLSCCSYSCKLCKKIVSVDRITYQNTSCFNKSCIALYFISQQRMNITTLGVFDWAISHQIKFMVLKTASMSIEFRYFNLVLHRICKLCKNNEFTHSCTLL